MITKKTVLVLGAGASMAYGLPSGDELRALVCEGLKPGGQVRSTLALAPLGGTFFPENAIDSFQHALTNSHPYSIDAFLAKRKHLVSIGKRAIAAALLPCERNDGLFGDWDNRTLRPPSEPIAMNTLSFRAGHPRPGCGHWYKRLVKNMEPEAQFEKNNLSVITFNYDRSFEHYMYTALRNVFDSQEMPDEAVAQKVSAIRIVHVYGQLGAVPWDTSSEEHVPYGAHPGNEGWLAHVNAAAKSIQIMPEARQDSPAFGAAHKLLEEAERIYFLGFGFDQMNVKRLFPEDLPEATSTKMYGTLRGLDLPGRLFLAGYGLKGAKDGLREGNPMSPRAYRFCDQNICDWLRENTHAQFD